MILFRNFLQPGQRFYVACLLLALFGCGLRFADLNRAGFVVHDARVFDLEARRTVDEGLQRYLLECNIMARGQSRVGFYFSYSLALAPYLFDGAVRSIFSTGVQLLAYALLCLFLARYLGVPAAVTIFLTLVCFAPQPGEHYPITSDPVAFHAPIALFFLGYNLHLAAKGWRLRPSRQWPIRGITFLCVLAAACVYEPLYVALAVVEGASIYALLRAALKSGEPRPIQRVACTEAPVWGAFVLYGVAYVVFRWLHPPVYAGTELGSGSFHFAAFAKAVYIYAISGLPGENLSHGLGEKLTRQAPGGWPLILSRQFGWQEFVLAAGVVMVFWTYIRYVPQVGRSENAAGWKWLPNFKSADSRRRMALQVAGVALVISFLAQVPLAVVPRYRDNTALWAPYVPSFFAFVGFSVALPALLAAAGDWLRTWRVAGALCVACLALLAVVNREANELVLAHQEKGYAGSRLVDLFMKSKAFAAISEGAVLVAPNLWDDISPGWDHYEPYWTEYVRLHGRRNLRVTRTMPELSQVPRVPGRMYYLEKQGSGTAGEPVLLLTDLFIKDNGSADRRSRSISVISAKPLDGLGLVFQRAAELQEDLGGIAIGTPEAAPLHPQFDGTSFFATLDVPDAFLPGTAYVVAESAGISKDKLAAFGRGLYMPMQGGAILDLEFGQGFAGLETNGVRRWHWSDGASGQGTMTVLNRLKRPVDGVFEACIETGYQERSKLELEFRGKKESVAVDENLCPLLRRWTFAPGKNEILIHSYARRMLSGNDPRFIVFGVYDWKLTPMH